MSQPIAPLTQFIGDGDKLFQDLGRLWTRIYEDPEYIRRIQHSRALQGTQALLDVNELYAVTNRRDVPVYHRQRWYPVKLTEASRNTSGSAFKFGMQPTPVFGEQTNPAFPSGSVFDFGRGITFSGSATYPLPSTLVSATCVTDNIAHPSAIYIRDRDFTIVSGCLVLKAYADPFVDGSPFTVTGEVGSREVTIWLCDASSNKDYVEDHIGYALGVATTSSPYAKAVVNSVWDTITSGATVGALQCALATVFGVPVILAASETVARVVSTSGVLRVITDANVYTLPEHAEVHGAVVEGAVLERGAPLTTAVVVYPPMLDPTSTGTTHIYPDFRSRMPAVTLGPGFFSDALVHGVALNWDSVPIIFNGYDSNGNPRLWFPLQGTDEDVATFWAGVWSRCEAENVNLRACFTGLVDDIVVERTGEVWGYVQPLDFMLRNLIGSNMVLVSVDANQLDVEARKRVSPAFLELVRNTLPAGVYLFMTEKRAVTPDTYALTTANVTDVVVRYFSKAQTSSGGYGSPRQGLAYNDRRISMKWIATPED
jgi:hypothetical protein